MPAHRLGGKQPVRVERQRRVVAGGGHASIIGDGAEWGNLDPRWCGGQSPRLQFSLPPPGFRRHTVTDEVMARQLNARRTGSRGSATARLLAAAGLVALLGGMLAIIMSASEDDAVPPAAVKTTAATPATKPW